MQAGTLLGFLLVTPECLPENERCRFSRGMAVCSDFICDGGGRTEEGVCLWQRVFLNENMFVCVCWGGGSKILGVKICSAKLAQTHSLKEFTYTIDCELWGFFYAPVRIRWDR